MDAFKPAAKTVCGIDCSTKSLAWAIFEGETPINCGEVVFNGSTVFERLKDAKRKTKALVEGGIIKADYVVIESAVRVNSLKTYRDLSYVYGCVIGELMQLNPKVEQVAPITWQVGLGNKAFSKLEKEAVYEEFPGKSKSWYQGKIRQLRKDKTLSIARQYFNIPSGSDNIGDAVGLSLYVVRNVVR